MTGRFWACLLAALLARAAGVAGAEAAPEERGVADALYGRKVVAFSLAGDAPVDQEYMARLSGLAPGRLLTRPALRAALRNLFATRFFSDLIAEGAPSGDGVILTVRFSAAPRIASLKLGGAKLPERGRLLDAIGLGVGASWSERAGEDAVRGMQRILHERGYFEAVVTPVVEAGADETSVNVRFDVAQGKHARVGPPIFSAPTEPLTPEALLKRARLKVGSYYRETKAREDAARYEALYERAGHARAEVRFDRADYDAATGVARARYTLFVGPRVVLVVNGAPESDVRKHPDSPWAKGDPPDEESVRRLAESLRRTYQEEGYARVKVDIAFATAPEQDTITFTIEKGARFVVAHVSYEGVRSIPLGDVLEVVVTKPRGLIATGRLVDRDLARDRDAIAGLYRLRGHPDARVLKTVVVDGVAPFTLDVTFAVEEGPTVLVADRKVEGSKAIPESEIVPLLVVAPGKPYNAADVDADVARLRSVYSDRGFVDARVDGEARLETPPPPRPLAADVTYSIFEGDAVSFGSTVIRGNRKTRLGIIEREIALKPGEPFSLSKLIETQQNLSRLGIFQRVEINHFPTDPDTKTRTVVVTVTEGKPWSILYGIGAEYAERDKRFAPRLSLGVSYNNLFGRALSVAVEGRSSLRETRLLATARDRSLFDWRAPVSLTVFRARELLPIEVARRGTFAEVEKRLSKTLKTTYRYQYEIVQPEVLDPAVLSRLERQNQRIAISSVTPSIVYDTRDDPIDPRNGFLMSADVKYAFSFLNANARFLKVLGQASMYRPFEKTVFAFSLRGGAIQSFAGCDAAVNPTCPPNLEIPIVERFFAGGRTSHRAFSLDDLGTFPDTLTIGPDGVIRPIGGNGLLIANVEWRVPVVGDFGISVFFDAGNVWSDYRRMKLSELRSGVGLGIHYLTPVGPLRLEYGRKLDRKTYVRSDGVVFAESPGAFSFSVGYGF